MNLDFTRLDSIAPGTNGEAPRQPARAEGHKDALQAQADYARIIEAAKEVIKEDRINYEMAEGCMLQVLQDIERKRNPYVLILFLAEAVGRLSNRGDEYFSQVKQKLIDVYGHDISDDNVNPDTGLIE